MSGGTLSHYEVLEELGRGGMGVVYRALDTRLQRYVAIKRLMVGEDRAELRERFLREAHALSQLNHPNIAIIHEIEECESGPVLVFEYCPGGSLRRRLTTMRGGGGQFSIEQVVHYSREIAAGLAHAHRHRIIHRDIKPENLLFSDEGRLKIIDFGISKLLDKPGLTESGETLGTTPYMSPEQIRAEPVDERSDVFSLGIVVYEMTAGCAPFAGENRTATAEQILKNPPPPLAHFRPGVPAELERVILRALAKKREGRFQTMTALDDALRSIDAGLTAESEVPTRTLVFPKVSRRRAMQVLIPAGVLVVATVEGYRAYFALPDEKQLAILPFEDVDHNAADQPLCDGLMESCASMLTEIDSFRDVLLVTPASEIRRQNVRSPADARRAFGATLAVTGAVQRTNPGWRVLVNLIDTGKPRQLRSRHIEAQGGEPSSIQERVTGEIVDMLAMELRPAERRKIAKRGTSNAAANDAFLRGTGYLREFQFGTNVQKAIEALENAVAIDPAFVQGRVNLALAYRQRFADTKDSHWLDAARAAAKKAVMDAPDFAPALAAEGAVELAADNLADAREYFARALRFEPANVEAVRGLAGCYEASGMLEEAERNYKKAIALRPKDWYTRSLLAVFYNDHARYADAAATFRDMLKIAPNNAMAHRNLGGVCIRLGRYQEAEAETKRSLAIEPTPAAYSNLGVICMYQHRYADAIVALEHAVEKPPESPVRAYQLWLNMGDAYRYSPEYTYKAAGAYQHSLDGLERLLAAKAGDPRLLSRRAELLAKMGRKQEALRDVEQAVHAAPDESTINYRAAVVYEICGERAKALQAVQNALRTGFPKADIEGDPELKQVVRKSATPA